ncbi:Uncharacterised protein [Bordetella pertussis]|nr:Uncharacterised protein [Bordetella pertussis]CPI18207.1 Uncharacterised protein [Bordetella pertussis]CPN52707.1 Uncharacterised protein [Bordetella pertussis]
MTKTLSNAACTTSTGKPPGAGRPPANEMTSGRSVTLRISRIAELVSCLARSEKEHSGSKGLSMEWS